VITGAPGAGKSTVAEALTTLLDNAGVPHGAIESEQLAWGSPWLEEALAYEQLAVLLRMQRGYGRRLFVVVATTETQEDLDGLLSAVGAARSLVVALTVPGEVASARVLEREPERWAARDSLAEHAAELAPVIPALPGVDLVLSTDGRDEDSVASELLEAMRARGLVSVDS
jgi:adenylate kinase family enzyme